MIAEQVEQRGATAADVDVACGLADRQSLDDGALRLAIAPERAGGAAASAILACMGDRAARTRVLRRMTSGDESDARIAHVYLRHHPLEGVADARRLAADIAGMTAAPAQARALDALSGARLADRETLEAVASLYPVASSPAVQNAIAGVLIRADYSQLDQPDLAQTLRRYRLKTRGDEDLVDVLLRQLQPR